MARPEHLAPPEIFYNDDEAKKYQKNSRMIKIQTSMTERALELLMLPEDQPCLLLDIGCGTGISSQCLSEEGHTWVGLDISEAMLGVARSRDLDGDLCLADIGHGLFFRAGVFDGAVSVSVIQWLCNVDKTEHSPKKRLTAFFQSLYNCLAHGSRAVFQFYPETPEQCDLIVSSAMRCGFSGGLVCDYPNSTKAKKLFLCITAGEPLNYAPKALGDDPEARPEGVDYTAARVRKETRRSKKHVTAREWILNKKSSQRRKGQDVRPDTKYTGRKRKHAF
eukprot:Amastigsp_a676523_397.p1 type:complete len:278 gc:universal Amastigsp_a676523_397:1032-199(-)